MVELSADEAGVLVGSAVVAFCFGIRFVAMLLTTGRPTASLAARGQLLLTPVCGLIVVYLVLVQWSKAQVKTYSVYILLFVLLGGVWLGVVVSMLPLLGLSFPDDALANANSAAAVTVCGAMLGTSLCYAGCNIGGGESIWSAILPALVATATLLALWFGIEITSGLADAITIDRDTASAMRLAGWLVAAGAILGRAMAGDYLSAEATLRDCVRQGWPAAGLAIGAIVMQVAFRPTPRRPERTILLYGLVPALAQLALAGGWIVSLGWWTVSGVVR